MYHDSFSRIVQILPKFIRWSYISQADLSAPDAFTANVSTPTTTAARLFNFTEYPARASLDALGGNYRTADGQSIWLADVELEPYQALLVRR